MFPADHTSSMRPFGILLGVFLGSCVAIFAGLAIVCFTFWVIMDDYPRLEAELPLLMLATAMFGGCSALGGMGMWGHLRRAAWRWAPLCLFWASLVGVGAYFWP